MLLKALLGLTTTIFIITPPEYVTQLRKTAGNSLPPDNIIFQLRKIAKASRPCALLINAAFQRKSFVCIAIISKNRRKIYEKIPQRLLLIFEMEIMPIIYIRISHATYAPKA